MSDSRYFANPNHCRRYNMTSRSDFDSVSLKPRVISLFFYTLSFFFNVSHFKPHNDDQVHLDSRGYFQCNLEKNSFNQSVTLLSWNVSNKLSGEQSAIGSKSRHWNCLSVFAGNQDCVALQPAQCRSMPAWAATAFTEPFARFRYNPTEFVRRPANARISEI